VLLKVLFFADGQKIGIYSIVEGYGSFYDVFDNQFGIKQRLNIVNVLVIFIRVDLYKE